MNSYNTNLQMITYMEANGPKIERNELYVYNIYSYIYTETIERDRGISAADVEVFWIRREMIFHM